MTDEQLQKFKEWFADYIKPFYGDDEYINTNLDVKKAHTYKTCQEMRYLVDKFGANADQKLLAETIALFHDLGRFEQFAKYRTYNDSKSVDHNTLALKVLTETGVLEPLEPDEQKIIETAIRCHSLKVLPDDLDDNTSFFAKLIRDADKLDIYRVVITGYKKYLSNPAAYKGELDFADKRDEYSPGIITAVLSGERINYSDLKTLNDMRLIQIGWVFDINFTVTVKCIKKRKILEEIFGFLPQTKDIEKVRDYVFDYMNKTIAAG